MRSSPTELVRNHSDRQLISMMRMKHREREKKPS